MYYGAVAGGTGRARGRDRTAAVAVVMLSAVVAAALVVSTRRDGRTQLLSRAAGSEAKWLSAKQSAEDLDSYFNAQPGGSHGRSPAYKLESKSPRVQQMLRSYSAKQSAADLDSYFNSLPGQGSHAVLPAKKTSRSQKKHEEAIDDGLPLLKKSRSKSPVQQADDKEHQENKEELQAFKFQNPSFKAKLDKVHEMWLKKHDNLPASKSEKREYSALVAKVVGNIGDIVRKGVEQGAPPPGVLHKQIAAAQAKFQKRHKHVKIH